MRALKYRILHRIDCLVLDQISHQTIRNIIHEEFRNPPSIPFDDFSDDDLETLRVATSLINNTNVLAKKASELNQQIFNAQLLRIKTSKERVQPQLAAFKKAYSEHAQRIAEGEYQETVVHNSLQQFKKEIAAIEF